MNYYLGENSKYNHMANLNQNNLIIACRNLISKYNIKKILLAYSGGVDSSVLLDCLHKISLDGSIKIRTMHINHGISTQAIIFEKHCSDVTNKLNITHESITVEIDSSSNIEEQCRNKRYEWLSKSCQLDEVIFTAHHEQDQVETFLLRLIRGSGARGLSSMKTESKCNEKLLYRPFLQTPKNMINEYCEDNLISFVEDKTNQDSIFDRNFLRNNIIPMIESRWPSINKNILNNILIQDIQSKYLVNSINDNLKYYCLGSNYQLSISKLNDEESYKRILIIHEWVIAQTGVILNLKQIYEILKIMKTSNDSNPLFTFSNIRITKNNNALIVSISNN